MRYTWTLLRLEMSFISCCLLGTFTENKNCRNKITLITTSEILIVQCILIHKQICQKVILYKAKYKNHLTQSKVVSLKLKRCCQFPSLWISSQINAAFDCAFNLPIHKTSIYTSLLRKLQWTTVLQKGEHLQGNKVILTSKL